MRLDWNSLISGAADALDGATVELVGWSAAAGDDAQSAYCLLTPEPVCCRGCLPGDPLACVEVFAQTPIPLGGEPVTLRGVLRRLCDDPLGWRYQMTGAEPVGPPPAPSLRLSRRDLIAAAPLMCLPIGAAAQEAPAEAVAEARRRDAVEFLSSRSSIDCHSHAGALLHVRQQDGRAPFRPLVAPMRDGGLAVVCLAIVSDSPTHRITPDGRIRPFREPETGELAAYAELGFARLHALIEDQGLRVARNAADLAAARPASPSVLVAAEGADFLEGDIALLDQAYDRHVLRHLQLTHYRVNALGDIQTEAPVHGGLTDFGAEVIRKCETMGVIVDVAHGTYDLVRQAATVARKPMILSHTSLAGHPGPHSRQISPDHARIIAETGGVIGVWPPARIFPDLPALADGIARLADTVGPAHVGVGTDMMGLVGPSALPDYALLPDLAAIFLARFSRDETAGVLGGNYLRVAKACLTG